MKRVMTIVGARPQFIKAAALSRVLRHDDTIKEVLVHTGQHHDVNMSATFFEELDIPEPAWNLGVHGGRHGDMTARMISALEELMLNDKPDLVLVYGDTNSTLAGALSAVKLHIPVAHVEAGLRSFNRRMPEEINRVLTDHASDILFAPTEAAVNNLKREGLHGRHHVLVGDIMFDVARYYAKRAESHFEQLAKELELHLGKFALVTIHRAENTDDDTRLPAIVRQLMELSGFMPVICPLHPRTRHRMQLLGLLEMAKRHIQFLEPVSYLQMVALERHAALIITDSGGVQKEAYFHQTPCLTLREETEWLELVEHGFNRLVDVHEDSLPELAQQMLGREYDWDIPLYGDGHTAELIRDELVAFFVSGTGTGTPPETGHFSRNMIHSGEKEA